MQLFLIDNINNRNEYYELNNNMNYYSIWEQIDKIIDDKNYSCEGFAIPTINKEENIITIHWIELFGDLSAPYIEIIECTEQIIKAFEHQIQLFKNKE